MPRTFKDLIKIIEKDGWQLVNQNGSHRQYKHPVKKAALPLHRIN